MEPEPASRYSEEHWGFTKLLENLLGPTAVYLGSGLQAWTKKSAENVGRIFGRAYERLGSPWTRQDQFLRRCSRAFWITERTRRTT